MHNVLLLLCVLHCVFGIAACSIPSLEKPECTQARDSVKQFYSWYLATDADERSSHPEIYGKFISSTFPLDRGSNWETDPYLLTNNFPKTFRVGTCKVTDSEHLELQVLLLWRDDTRNEQREVHVETVKVGDKWLINNVAEARTK
jgi:hypothetical protein